MDSRKIPWIISFVGCWIAGYQVSVNGHTPIPLQPVVEGDQVKIDFVQQPGASKFVSLVLYAGSVASLLQGLKDEEGRKNTITPSATPCSPPITLIDEEEDEEEELPNQETTVKQSFQLPSVSFAKDEPIDFSKITPKKEERSIDELIIRHSLNDGAAKHILVVARTGSGKTNNLIRMIKLLHDTLQGRCQFLISSAKAEAFFLLDEIPWTEGDGHPCLLGLNEPENINVMFNRLNYVTAILNERIARAKDEYKKGNAVKFEPLFVVLDEWQVCIAMMENIDPKATKQFLTSVTNLILLGRQYNVIVWIFSQSHQVQNMGLNSGVKENIGLIVLGSPHARDSLSAALVGKLALYPKEIGQPLGEKASTLMDDGQYVCYCSFEGHHVLPIPKIDSDQMARSRLSKAIEPETTDIRSTDLWEE
jgi:hypothetical protein